MLNFIHLDVSGNSQKIIYNHSTIQINQRAKIKMGGVKITTKFDLKLALRKP